MTFPHPLYIKTTLCPSPGPKSWAIMYNFGVKTFALNYRNYTQALQSYFIYFYIVINLSPWLMTVGCSVCIFLLLSIRRVIHVIKTV